MAKWCCKCDELIDDCKCEERERMREQIIDDIQAANQRKLDSHIGHRSCEY